MTRIVTLAGYAAVVAVMAVVEVVARRTGRVSTLGQALHAVATQRAARFLLLSGWLWLGWHLFVRASR